MPELVLWKKRQLESMRRDMHRMFERVLGDFSPAGGAGIMRMSPAVDLAESGESLVLKAEIPGVNPEDIEIDISDNVVRISGEIKQENIRRNEGYQRVERNYGSFSRAVQLPCRVIAKDVTAAYKNGVLKIVMPKCGPEKPRRIRVKTGE